MKLSRRKMVSYLGASAASILISCNKLSSKKAQSGSNNVKPAPKKAAPSNIKEALLILAIVLGPWKNESEAGKFISRLLSSPRRDSRYGQRKRELISIATNLIEQKPGSTVNFSAASDDHRKALNMFLVDVYSSENIYYYLNDMPPFGQCIGSQAYVHDAPKSWRHTKGS